MSGYDKTRTVFVVHGRNIAAKDAMSRFLKSLDLKPLTWDDVVDLTGKTGPTTFEVVKMGLAAAGAIIVLFTPDEVAALLPQFRESSESNLPEYRPRANVLIELGMAFALDPEHTIQVRLGQIPEFSDLKGIDYIQLTNAVGKRQALARRLKNAGLAVDMNGCYWDATSAGDFEEAINPNSFGRYVPCNLQIVRDAEIFSGGCKYLQDGDHVEVVIYAPTGAWHPTDKKREWFQTIADCLRNADENKPNKLTVFNGVYGLPPLPDEPSEQQLACFDKELDKMEGLFKPFNGIERAHLYYIEGNTENVPGTGTIIVDDTLLALAWAVSGRFTVDYGLLLNEQKEITNTVLRWFNLHVKIIAGDNLIQDIRRGKGLYQGMDDIRHKHGLRRKHAEC